MEINSKVNSFQATQTALNGFNKGAENLNKNAIDIANSLNNDEVTKSQVNQNYLEKVNQEPPASIEDSLIGTVQNKNQMLALLKVIEIEKELYDNSLGKIFDGRA